MILDTRLGNTPRWFLTPPKDYTMRVPDEIRDCVVFLGAEAKALSGRIVELPRFGGQVHIRLPDLRLSTSFRMLLVTDSRAPNGVAGCWRTLRGSRTAPVARPDASQIAPG